MNRPFGRSLALIAAISSIFNTMGRNIQSQQMVNALAQSKQYKSRGHGRNKRSGVNVKALNKMYRQNRGSGYTPYRGNKEKLRRAMRYVLAAAHVLLLQSSRKSSRCESTPRRLWHAVNAEGYPYNLSYTTRRAALAVGGFAVLE